ncbi:MAG: acyl-CoA synthetase FdrA [Candidatus Bathyarchaeota archaeon]|nr:acyl-CoA synthetase FdrA [Candidatus Bathyarchaeota archaeon]MDH5746017.1 acyl-CoA synthetase FdrA [Candidatus Bathyarchaeota archaeon]
MVVRVIVRKNTYRDSVTLMKISNEASRLDGVSQAAVIMATPTNKQLLKDVKLLTDEAEKASPNDLIIALDAQNEEIMKSAISEVDRLLSARETAETEVLPKTLDSALRLMPDANLVMISVPGDFAKREALKALRKGLNVFLFSSNVPVEQELELKKISREEGLLMMGPDCGTAIINNIVLGFGNVVSQGSIGIVSASGTGLQQVSTLIHERGLGISQAIGTGGNDLSGTVGGIMMIEGIKLLEEDEKTQAIVLISKPPDPKIGEKVLEVASRCKKPVVVNFIGGEIDVIRKGGCVAATILEDAARIVCALVQGKKPEKTIFTIPKKRITSIANTESSKLSRMQKYIRGLFSGGTLCYETLVILAPLIGNVRSNTPLKPDYKLEDVNASKKHTCVDMGSEEFTVGRPHPMIDFTLRKRRIIQEAKDPETAVVLLDVVLGYGAHQNPAAELVPSIAEAKTAAEQSGRFLSVVASVVGTPEDPQDLRKQKRKLEEVGVIVMPSNAQAARIAALVVTRGAVEEKLFG